MTRIFRGRFDGRIDSKGRVIIPAHFRQSCLAVDSEAVRFVVTNSQSRGRRCLDVYTLEEWEALELRMESLPSFKPEVLDFKRFYLACGIESKLDGQNRMLLPAHLRDFSNLNDNIVFIGMGKKFEIWSLSVWTEMHKGMAEQFDSVMGAVAQLEVGVV